MQLSVFSTDNQKSGFRLQYIEVYNWGTFDEHIHSIKPLGETSLLTGANGSGKTTFVDALLTLIVPEKRYRFYNQSSGSEKKGDRTEESYVLGGYGTLNSESTGATKTLYLRENKDSAYSILLANFCNEAQQEVTLVQIRYFVNGDMKRVFVIAHKSLHIEDDFKPFDLSGNWKRRIEQQYNKGSRKQVEWFDVAGKYAQRLTEVLGMQSTQALSLFNQTVGIKVLGNLDDFIRTHMLEPRNMEELFQELKKHLATLLDAKRNIEKSEEQIRLLKPVQEHYEQFQSLTISDNQLNSALQTAAVWKRFTHDKLLEQAVEEGNDRNKIFERQIENLRTNIESLIDEERNTRNQIDQNTAGQRLKMLEKDLNELSKKKKDAEANLTLFTDWCNILHLDERNPADESSYSRILKECNKAAMRLERENRLNDEDDFDARNSLKSSKDEKDRIEVELNILLHNKSNIPAPLINLRKDVCTALKLDVSELPFAGELIQVKTEEYHWQPALEKLLHSFSLRLLVPDKHYKKITRYINQTDIGTRLIYYHVKDHLTLHADKDTVFHKMEFHPDHKLSAWVQQQIIQNFGYSCVDDEKELERMEKAITLNGLIKSRDRHEKDDRPGKNDPGRYVMGWNNEKKKEALIQQRNKLSDQITTAEKTLQRCKNKGDRLQKQFYALSRIQEHTGFTSLNVESVQRAIHKAEEQVKELSQSNDQLKSLTLQLADILQQREKAQKDLEDLSGDKTVLQGQINEMIRHRESLTLLLQHITETDKDNLLAFQQQHAATMADVTLDTIDSTYSAFREETENKVTEVRSALHKAELQLNKSINQIKNPSTAIAQRFPDWYGDVQSLPDDAAHAEEYKEWLDKLTTENLPRYRKDFENFINDTITYKIGGLSEEMEKWEREINNSVVKLNQSLGAINFNRLPDTYIQLGKRSVPDTTIKEFRNNLLNALPQAANWQQSKFEEKSLHFHQKVQPLIDSLDENEAYRTKVMDVRNWFEFWADEKYANTNELKKTYRQMGQLSGGEKAQLTYTILCSAIAYQFGITREGKNSKSLRFIAVDESFSNQDEDKATYLMELCKQLHLQLLVVTPSDKIQVVQDFIAHVHLVQRVNGRHSVLYNMTIKELQQKMGKA